MFVHIQVPASLRCAHRLHSAAVMMGRQCDGRHSQRGGRQAAPAPAEGPYLSLGETAIKASAGEAGGPSWVREEVVPELQAALH